MTAIALSLPDANATRKLGNLLGQTLPAGTVLLLEGNLGSGKTTLVQGIGEGLGITEAIASPTFTLVNEYLEGRIPLYHLDLYRLQPSEVATLYLESYWDGLENPLGIVAIEWAERMEQRPPNYLRIRLIGAETPARQVYLEEIGQLPIRLSELLEIYEPT
jgi:tRNA threonylcarbamoyladenosine biosynthesis protein TsaE